MDRENSKYARLLSNPEYSLPTEWFDEAIMNWLSGNMGKYLQHNPNACHYFMKDEDHVGDVANAISLDEANREHLIKFIKSLGEEYRSGYAFGYLAKRLAEANLADLVAHAQSHHFQDPDKIEALLPKMSSDALVSILGRVDWSKARWQWTHLETALSRLSPVQIRVMVGATFSSYDKYQNLAPRLASTLAAKLPFSDLGAFATQYLPKYHELTCMSCGRPGGSSEDEIRSKPGYTLHRKVCDKDNKFPSLYLTLKERMQSRT